MRPWRISDGSLGLELSNRVYSGALSRGQKDWECAELGLVERGGCYNVVLANSLVVIPYLNLVTFYSYLSFSSLPSFQLSSLFLLYFFHHSTNIYWDQLDARYCVAGNTAGYQSAKLHPPLELTYFMRTDRLCTGKWTCKHVTTRTLKTVSGEEDCTLSGRCLS